MRRLIEVFQRQPVDLFGDFLAQIIGDLLSHTGHHPALDIVEQGGKQIDAEQGIQDRGDLCEVDAAGAAVLGSQTFGQRRRCRAEDTGSDDREDRGAQGEQGNDQDLQIERLHVTDQLDDRAAEVLGFITGHHAARGAHAGPVIGFSLLTHRASSSSLSCDRAIS